MDANTPPPASAARVQAALIATAYAAMSAAVDASIRISYQKTYSLVSIGPSQIATTEMASLMLPSGTKMAP